MFLLMVREAKPLLNLPIVLQDAIVAAFFAAAAGFMVYRRLKKKTKSCPACQSDCAAGETLPQRRAEIQSAAGLD